MKAVLMWAGFQMAKEVEFPPPIIYRLHLPIEWDAPHSEGPPLPTVVTPWEFRLVSHFEDTAIYESIEAPWEVQIRNALSVRDSVIASRKDPLDDWMN